MGFILNGFDWSWGEPLLHEVYISKDALCDRDSDVLKPFGEESLYLKTVLTVR